MTKHTPGPWINDGGLVTGRESRARYAGTPSGDIFDAGDWPVELRDEARANAHIIAAAPDMLAALKALLPWQPADGGAEWDAARAAVAKAEGRES